MIKEGDHVLNLGSQSGQEAIMMAKKVGPKGKVYIFEPYSFSYKIMRKSVILNQLQNWTITYNMGASNKFEIGKITVDFINTGGS
jgi:FkbM family methyltransferase